jgi:ferritin-like metal-binding protein YciE
MRVAERAGDPATAAVAQSIRDEEREMSDRLEANFDRAVEASGPGDLNSYLADAHAIEAQAIKLLERAPKIGGEGELTRIYTEHEQESREHQRLVEQRLEARGGSPSVIKDAAMRLGALNWGAFFAAQPDTPAKLAAFAYAFEFLEVGGYEQLKRVARREGDAETEQVADRILVEERAMADRLAAGFDDALDASLAAREAHA